MDEQQVWAVDDDSVAESVVSDDGAVDDADLLYDEAEGNVQL